MVGEAVQTFTVYPKPMEKKTHRLRMCDAQTVRVYLQKHDIKPIQVKDCGVLPRKIYRSEIEIQNEMFKFVFEDFSQLVWVKEFEEWGVYYPSWVRIIYVPVNVPLWKDSFAKGVNEGDFMRECKEALTNPHYELLANGQGDDDLIGFEGYGCG